MKIPPEKKTTDRETETPATRVKEILAKVRPLAEEYYSITGRPLGVKDEVATYAATELLGLEPLPARTGGYDALRRTADGVERIRIVGKTFDPATKSGRHIGAIRLDAACDIVILVLLDEATLDLFEIWEATFAAITIRPAPGGETGRDDRDAIAVSDFKHIGRRIWPG